MYFIKVFAVITLSAYASCQRGISYGISGLITSASADSSDSDRRSLLTGSSTIEQSQNSRGSRGKVIGNSVLDFEPSMTMFTNGAGPTVRYRQQQSLRSSQMPQPPTRFITTGPSIGMVRNGIDDEVEDIDEVERPALLSNSKETSNENNMEVSKFVSVFVSPPEPLQPKRSKPIKAAQQKLHYNILFIKAPNTLPESQEIELPPSPQTKTMVYVLLKRPEMKDLLRITQSPTQKPQKPEVFFIRYKNDEKIESDKMSSKSKNKAEEEDTKAEDDGKDMSEITAQQQQGKGKAVKLRLENAKGTNGNNAISRVNSNVGGYENSDVSDNDFSSRETYDENELLLSSRQQQYNQNQRLVHSGYSFSPMNTRYGIVS